MYQLETRADFFLAQRVDSYMVKLEDEARIICIHSSQGAKYKSHLGQI